MSLLTFTQDKLSQARIIKEIQLYAAHFILLIEASEQNNSQKAASQSVRSGMFNLGKKGS